METLIEISIGCSDDVELQLLTAMVSVIERFTVSCGEIEEALPRVIEWLDSRYCKYT